MIKVVIALLVFCCAIQISVGQKKAGPVKIIEATKQNWVSGAPGGKTGTKFAIKVYINTAAKVEFKNIWIGEENVPFDVEFFSLDIPKKIENGDSLLLTYNKINGERNETNGVKRCPCKYKGAAIIEALVDGKARYFIVKGFTEVAPLKGR